MDTFDEIPDGVVISANGVTLRSWTCRDAAALTTVFDDPDVAFRTPLPSPFVLTDAHAYLANRDGYVDLAITEVGGQPVGQIMMNLNSHAVSYIVAPAARGRGLASHALSMICKYGSTDLGLSTLYLEIEPDNRPSVAVAQRCGFELANAPLEAITDKGRDYLLATWERAL